MAQPRAEVTVDFETRTQRLAGRRGSAISVFSKICGRIHSTESSNQIEHQIRLRISQLVRNGNRDMLEASGLRGHSLHSHISRSPSAVRVRRDSEGAWRVQRHAGAAQAASSLIQHPQYVYVGTAKAHGGHNNMLVQLRLLSRLIHHIDRRSEDFL